MLHRIKHLIDNDVAEDLIVETASPLSFDGNAGEKQYIDVTIVGDAIVEANETFTIELKAMGPPGTTYRFATGASEDQVELRTPERDESEAGEEAPAPSSPPAPRRSPSRPITA